MKDMEKELMISREQGPAALFGSYRDYMEMIHLYNGAIKQLKIRLEVLNDEFTVRYARSPIHHVETRIKSATSVVKKLKNKKVEVSIPNAMEYVNDIAGVRVVCSYIDDVYRVAEMLKRQGDIEIIKEKDYIKEPNYNGYRSLHLDVRVPVYLSASKEMIAAEIQLRTVAMDFWASLEHQLKYKSNLPDESEISEQLRQCAEIITSTDEKMLELRKKIEAAEDIPTEEDELFERLRKFDMPIH